MGLATALGAGLLIGLERERRKRRGPDREAAGIRSFTLAAIAGGGAQAVGQPALVAAGALLVAALAATAYAMSRRVRPNRPPPDPGTTTELALFVTYLVGVLSAQQPALGAGAAVVVAGLLAARERLHRFATRVLSEHELHDALLLAALVLVLLPLAPAQREPWLGGLSPRALLLLMVLVLVLQALGHVGARLFGARAGVALAGFLGGFVSSTATIAALGARAREEPAAWRALASAAGLSGVATWVQAMLMLAVLAPPAASALAPAAAAGASVAATAAAVAGRRAPSPRAAASPTRGPLQWRDALLVTLLLTAVSAAVAWAQSRFGTAGLMAGTAIAALADAHAPIAALGARAGSGLLADPGLLRDAVLVAIAANSLTRSVTAFGAGGPRFGATVTAALAAAVAAALGVSRLA